MMNKFFRSVLIPLLFAVFSMDALYNMTNTVSASVEVLKENAQKAASAMEAARGRDDSDTAAQGDQDFQHKPAAVCLNGTFYHGTGR